MMPCYQQHIDVLSRRSLYRFVKVTTWMGLSMGWVSCWPLSGTFCASGGLGLARAALATCLVAPCCQQHIAAQAAPQT